jgi:hypothetical protein
MEGHRITLVVDASKTPVGFFGLSGYSGAEPVPCFFSSSGASELSRDGVLVFVLCLNPRVCRTSETVRIFVVVHQLDSFPRPFGFGQLDNCRPGFDDGKIGQESEREGAKMSCLSFESVHGAGLCPFYILNNSLRSSLNYAS